MVIDRGDNLDQLLGPSQHDRNFQQILRQREVKQKYWRGKIPEEERIVKCAIYD